MSESDITDDAMFETMRDLDEQIGITGASDEYEMGYLRITKEEKQAEILANETVLLNENRGSPELLTLINHPVDGAPNMFFYAIKHRKYTPVRTMLEIFIQDQSVQCSEILLGVDAQGNNCLHFLISNYANHSADAIVLSTQTPSEIQRGGSKNFQVILNHLKRFDIINQLATSKNETGDTMIVWAIKNKMQDTAHDLLTILPPGNQLNILKGTENCVTSCRDMKHDETCKKGYNMLMLALDVGNVHGPLIDLILKIVSKFGDERTKSEIVMGSNEPQVISRYQNSIRLAAMRGEGNSLKVLLEKCVPSKHWCNAFIEVGPCGYSAMALILEADDMETIGYLLKEDQQDRYQTLLLQKLNDPNVTSDIEARVHQQLNNLDQSPRPPSVADLQKALRDPGTLENFMHQRMTQRAIEFFYNTDLFQKRYLIPTWKQHVPTHRRGNVGIQPKLLDNWSRPTALLCYNTKFSDATTLKYTAVEIMCMETALKHLGWEHDMIEVNDKDWTFDQLMDMLKKKIKAEANRCSFFFFCVTSHGSAGQICGCDGRSGKIDKILDAITDVKTGIPAFIPKALIFDMCRVEQHMAGNTQTMLKANNILLLNATISGSKSKELQYLPQLAEQIKAADGKTSLLDMHIVASRVVNKSTGRIAHVEMTGLSICLKRFDSRYFSCSECEKSIMDCITECVTCDRCHRCYNLECVGLTEQHKQFTSSTTHVWYCQTCYDNRHDY